MTAPETASFRVSFADHPEHGPQDDYVLTDVDRHDGFTGFGAEEMVNAVPEILRRACVKAAARYVDYDDYVENGKGDSAYMDECDRLADGFVPTGVLPERGLELRRWRCNGIYLNSDGDGWTGFVMAADAEEAKFQAKWQMALASAGDTRKRDDFAMLMDGCGIDHVAEEPVLVEELAEAARDLIAEIGPGSGPAYDRVVDLLGKLGIEAAPAPSPGR